MRKIFCLILLLNTLIALGQENETKVFFSKEGEISFFSEAPFEDIDATSKKAIGFLNIETGELRFSVAIESFIFPNSLMQKHFNTQYMDSDKYPKADFKGQILNPEELTSLGQTPQLFKVKGDLTIREITKTYQMEAYLSKVKTAYQGETSFVVKLEDHDVKVPKLMFKTIADEIELKINILFTPYQQGE